MREKLSKPTQKPDPLDPKSTRPYLEILATPLVKLSTNLKLEDRPSYPSRLRREKQSERQRPKLEKPATFHFALPGFSPVLGDTTGWILLPTIPFWFSYHPQPLRVVDLLWFSRCSYRVIELDFGVAATRGSKTPIALNSAQRDVSDLNFTVTVS